VEITAALKARIRSLCEQQKLAVLATTGDNRPYANLVAFVCDPAMTYLLFATPRTTRKFLNLQSNPAAALLIHDAANRKADFTQAISLTVLGTASEALPPDKEAYQADYLKKHPHLRSFVTSKECALLRVAIDTLIVVSDFQTVHTWHLSPATEADGL
jgi:nitroimidazol reductase NimA-like FMN-containing flavoprotein (pyridoxamine 5'-phosphate oxidase superfamily)